MKGSKTRKGGPFPARRAVAGQGKESVNGRTKWFAGLGLGRTKWFAGPPPDPFPPPRPVLEVCLVF